MLLSILIFLILSIFFITFISYFTKYSDLQVYKFGFIITIFLFIVSLALLLFFDNNTIDFQYITNWYIFEYFTFGFVDFDFGIDGISIYFILLTTFLIPICLLASWDSIKIYKKEFIIAFLILEFFLILVFSVLNLFLFYIFFESILIPMFFIIGLWGSRTRKIKAAYYFFLYTLFGSLLLLIGIIFISLELGSTSIYSLYLNNFSFERQIFLWIVFFISFAVKVPMFPIHVWLPEAHVEAPTAGSVILAGLLLKLGGYGILRFLIPMFPQANLFFLPLTFTLIILAIIYSSLTTLRQVDLKKIIAYSSVAHMNFSLLGLFSFNIYGILGALLLMISHGLVSSALFLCIGVLYDRHHTRLLKYYSGLTTVMPLFSIIFLFFSLANLSFPGTSSFIGEFLVLLGILKLNTTITFLSATTMIFSGAYSIWLYNRIAFGNLKIYYIKNFIDLTKKEFLIFLPLIVFTILLGIYPSICIDILYSSSLFVKFFYN